MSVKDIKQFHNLLNELIHLPQESEWVEFKNNNKDPKVIGENISAMANSATIASRLNAYMVWGIEDTTHNIIGTTFKPSCTKHNNQELESWLLQKLEPKIDFSFIMSSIKALLPSYEEIGLSFRREVNTYPDIALRELVANALIHQDFNISGTSPMVEIFTHRIEITNAGAPLVEVNRFMDKPPRSRNEILAKLMRRMDICEERGTGIDKVISLIEHNQMPAPLFEDLGDYTRVALFSYKEFSSMSKEERLRACYWHCVFKYTIHEQMNNTSLRQRFENSVSGPMISKIIREAQEKRLIKVFDEEAGTKAMKYIPFWA